MGNNIVMGATFNALDTIIFDDNRKIVCEKSNPGLIDGNDLFYH